MSNKKNGSKIVLFSCNWHSYSSLEYAGKNKMTHPTGIFPILISCLGRITPGILLKAFEKGADGVFLIGCPEGDCHYQTGPDQIKAVVEETRQLIKLLGYDENQLQLEFIHTDDRDKFADRLNDFVVNIGEPEVVI